MALHKKGFALLLSFFISALIISAQTANDKELKFESGFLTSFDGTKIYYEVSGKGEAVILVHGFIVNGQSWKHTALYNDLASAGYKVVLLDQRGNGRSDKPQDSTAYENDAEAKDIMALTKKLGIHKYIAVGYSRGSIIVSRLLVLDKNIQKGVIGGMGSDFTNPEWPRRIMFYHALRGDSVPELKAMVENVQKKGLDQKALAYLQRSQPSTSKEELSKIKRQVLVICGDHDIDNGSAKDLSSLIPGAIFTTTPGVHNDANQSKEFSAAVISFLQKK
ncbi:MAG: alpha/beta fold hydrolase [Bacteroidota bacterium]